MVCPGPGKTKVWFASYGAPTGTEKSIRSATGGAPTRNEPFDVVLVIPPGTAALRELVAMSKPEIGSCALSSPSRVPRMTASGSSSTVPTEATAPAKTVTDVSFSE